MSYVIKTEDGQFVCGGNMWRHTLGDYDQARRYQTKAGAKRALRSHPVDALLQQYETDATVIEDILAVPEPTSGT